MGYDVIHSAEPLLPGLGTALFGDSERAVFVDDRLGVVRVDAVDPRANSQSTFDIIQNDLWRQYAGSFHAFATSGGHGFVPVEDIAFVAPYRHPRMILGIGLNYLDHANDLAAPLPDSPASFIKADHTIVGPNDPIPLPWQSSRVTVEAELGLVIGKTARNVSQADALDYVAGVVPVLDQTAEDILAENPRFLTRAKNFPGFFSFGPWITALPNFLRGQTLEAATVSTMRNGAVHRENIISNMSYSPRYLVSFHSEIMPLSPGDIISTGTPGAAVVGAGDLAECRISGLPSLTNPAGADGDGERSRRGES